MQKIYKNRHTIEIITKKSKKFNERRTLFKFWSIFLYNSANGSYFYLDFQYILYVYICIYRNKLLKEEVYN